MGKLMGNTRTETTYYLEQDFIILQLLQKNNKPLCGSFILELAQFLYM